MLVNLKPILEYAEQNNCAIGAFNVPNIASILAVMEAAEFLRVPVILMHAQIHENLVPIDIIGGAMISAAKKASIPVCVHLDHGEDLDYLKKALDLGFTSIMYDGSNKNYEENVIFTKKTVELANQYNATVEGEIGIMASNLPIKEKIGIYTNPSQAIAFAKETKIDAMACSFGTIHGIYLNKPKIDYSIIEKIREKVNIPIVMHGGSGVLIEQYKLCIEKGIRKINYYTYMSKAGGEMITNKVLNSMDRKINYYHDFVLIGKQAMKENVLSAMKIFYNL